MEDIVLERKFKTKSKKKEPDMYKVYLLNDAFTTFEHVIAVLMAIFQKGFEEAYQITMSIHKTGKGLAGVYIKDVAISKKKKVEAFSKQEGYPLRAVVEK